MPKSLFPSAAAGGETGTRPNNCACSCRAVAASRLVAASAWWQSVQSRWVR